MVPGNGGTSIVQEGQGQGSAKKGAAGAGAKYSPADRSPRNNKSGAGTPRQSQSQNQPADVQSRADREILDKYKAQRTSALAKLESSLQHSGERENVLGPGRPNTAG